MAVRVNDGEAHVDNEIVVQYPTRKGDLKPGDLVMTCEVHQVTRVESADFIEVRDLDGGGPRIMELGWGQHSIAKVIRGVRPIKTRRKRP